MLTILPLSAAALAQDEEILEPVHIFNEHYATDDMYKVAEVVTREFRSGKTKSQWVKELGSILQRLEYERLHSKTVDVAKEEDRAVVHVQARNSTRVGDTDQDELFFMIRDNDHWLIDDMQVYNEEITAPKSDL